MLTRELLRTRSAGIYVHPKFVATDDPELLAYAADLIRIYTESVGSRRAELDELCRSLAAGLTDLKLARGILRIVDSRAVFSTPPNADCVRRRQTVFSRSAALLKAGRLPDDPYAVRAAVLTGDAAAGPESAPETALYSDLPGCETLLKLKKMFPREVLERYNLALVQSLVLYAASLEAEFPAGTEAPLLRRLFRYLRFFRLLFRAERRGGTFRLTLDGPGSLLDNQSTRYGLQLASFFPALCQLPVWKAACAVQLPGKSPQRLILSQEHRLVSHFANFSACTPEEFTLFAASFRKLSTAWTLDEAPDFLRLPDSPQSVIFPDFVFRSAEGTRMAALELFHRWHATALQERLKFCAAHPEVPLLLGVDRSLLKKDGLLKKQLENDVFFQTHGLIFHDYPGVENVLSLLDPAPDAKKKRLRGL